MNNKKIELSIIVPCLNEELMVPIFITEIKKLIGKLPTFELIFVDDGSTDKTNEKIIEAGKMNEDLNIRLIKLSRNWGHQKALWAGMDNCRGASCVSLDIDLQDPPEIIIQMVERWKSGFDVVLGQRIDRSTDTIFKKTTANLFYWFMTKFINKNFPRGVGDFRLIDKKVIEQMRNLNDCSPYWRGLVVWMGFKTAFVQYKREARVAGETKYPFLKMLNFASNAVISFSTKPLKLVSLIGLGFSLISFILMSFYIFQKIVGISTFIPGWVSIVSLITFLSGIHLLCLGVIGHYIGKIYEQSLNRPRFIIDQVSDISSKE